MGNDFSANGRGSDPNGGSGGGCCRYQRRKESVPAEERVQPQANAEREEKSGEFERGAVSWRRTTINHSLEVKAFFSAAWLMKRARTARVSLQPRVKRHQRTRALSGDCKSPEERKFWPTDWQEQKPVQAVRRRQVRQKPCTSAVGTA